MDYKFYIFILYAFVLAASSSSILVFNKKELSINDTEGIGSLKIKLAKKPSKAVTLTFDSNLLNFDACSLTFQPNEWNSYQTLRVYPKRLGAWDKTLPAPKSNINFIIDSKSCGFPQNESFPITRVFERPKSCTSRGDPYIRSFDNVNYDSNLEGFFYLIKSKDLTVQTFQKPSGKTFTVHGKVKKQIYNYGVAIRYGSSYVIYDIRDERDRDVPRGLISHKTEFFLKQRPGDAMDIDSEEQRASYVIEIKAGNSLIRLDFFYSNNKKEFSHINVYATVDASFKGKVRGLCNQFEGDQKDIPDGQQILYGANNKEYKEAKEDEFVGTWAVPDNDNIFYENIAKSVPAINLVQEDCVLPTTQLNPYPCPPINRFRPTSTISTTTKKRTSSIKSKSTSVKGETKSSTGRTTSSRKPIASPSTTNTRKTKTTNPSRSTSRSIKSTTSTTRLTVTQNTSARTSIGTRRTSSKATTAKVQTSSGLSASDPTSFRSNTRSSVLTSSKVFTISSTEPILTATSSVGSSITPSIHKHAPSTNTISSTSSSLPRSTTTTSSIATTSLVSIPRTNHVVTTSSSSSYSSDAQTTYISLTLTTVSIGKSKPSTTTVSLSSSSFTTHTFTSLSIGRSTTSLPSISFSLSRTTTITSSATTLSIGKSTPTSTTLSSTSSSLPSHTTTRSIQSTTSKQEISATTTSNLITSSRTTTTTLQTPFFARFSSESYLFSSSINASFTTTSTTATPTQTRKKCKVKSAKSKKCKIRKTSPPIRKCSIKKSNRIINKV